MNFWNEAKLKEALPGVKTYNFPAEWSSSGIVIWQDNFEPGNMILARGENETRGIILKKNTDLIPDCAAIAAVKPMEYFKYNKPIIELVTGSSDALIQMARYIRKFFSGKVISVTGSCGKSTTTQMIVNILSGKYKVNSNIKSKANTTWGIAWNMTKFGIDDDYWVIETSLGGGMSRNSAVTKPDYAIITNVAPVHLTKNMQLSDIAEEKSRIFNSMKENSTAIIYKEMEYYDIVEKAAKFKNLNIITFGESTDADIRIIRDGENKFLADGNTYVLNSEPVGKHILFDMAAAIAAAKSEGIDIETALDTLRNFKCLNGRGEIFETNLPDKKHITVIDESYNANPLSMKYAISSFGERYKNERKVLLLGDMAECGENSNELHSDLAETVEMSSPQKVLLCGTEIKNLYEKIKNKIDCKYYENISDLRSAIGNELTDGDHIMIKSSHSSGLHTITDLLRQQNDLK